MTMRRVLVATSVGLLVAIFPLRLPAALATSRPVPKASEYVSAIDHTLQAVESVNAVNGFLTPSTVHYVVGDAITFIVSEASGHVPKGTVSFSVPGSYGGACQSVRVVALAARCQIRYMNAGPFTVTARYLGSDTSHAVSSKSITVSRETGFITAQLNSTVVGNPATLGTDAYFSAKVSETSILDPGGSVEFSSQSLHCTASVAASPGAPAQADCQIDYPDPGQFGANHKVSATLRAGNGVTATTSFPIFVQ